MKPVNQDQYGKNAKYYGNCLQACVASLFELPLEAVPHFMLFKDKWWEALYLFIQSINYELLGFVDGEPPHNGQYYIVSIDFGEQYDFGHSVIFKDGKITHDPHPIKWDATDKVVGYYSIVKKQLI